MNETPPSALTVSTVRELGGAWEEVIRKGGEEEASSVRAVRDVCAAHGDRAGVGVDVDAQGSSLREGETRFPLYARIECRAFVSE